MNKTYDKIERLNLEHSKLLHQLSVLNGAVNKLGVSVLEGEVELEEARDQYNLLKVEQVQVEHAYEENERERKLELHKLNKKGQYDR